MKRTATLLGLLALLIQPAAAWQPSHWCYIDWPWAYDNAWGDWYWLRTSDAQWVYGYPPAQRWQPLQDSGLAQGWTWFGWPYAFCQDNGAWYYEALAEPLASPAYGGRHEGFCK